MDFDLRSIVQASETRTCNEYSRLFFERAKELDQDATSRERDVCIFYGVLTSFFLRLDHPNDPFSPEWFFASGQRSTIPSDIPVYLWDILLVQLPEIDDVELQARCADILWVLKKGDFRAARIAVTAYIQSADRLRDPAKWSESGVRIDRAHQLALQLGRKGDAFGEVVEYVEGVLAELNGTDPLWFSHKLMLLLINMDVGDPVKYAALCEEIIQRSLADHYWERARAYGWLRAQWLNRANLSSESRKAQEDAAESYVSEALWLLSHDPPNYVRAGTALTRAVEALRQCRAPHDRIQRVHQMLLDTQENALTDLELHSFSIDIKAPLQSAIEAVRQKSLHEAILILAQAYYPQPVKKLREEVEQFKQNAPLYWLAQVNYLDERGRVKARRPGFGPGDVHDGEEEAIRIEMVHRARYVQGIKVAAWVSPSLHQITLEHHVRLEDFYPFVANNPFIPPSHEMIFAQGLYHGIVGEFALSTSLLVPQIENSIRYLLNQRGVVTSSLDSDGVAEDWDLGRLLYKTPEVVETFGEDILFDLRALLVEKSGPNLRNELAHGKLTYAELISSETEYFWWLTLYLCCYPTLRSEIEGKIGLGDSPLGEADDI